MDLYIKQNTEPDNILFHIFDKAGVPAFTVTGDLGSLGGKLYLLDAGGTEAARIHRLGVSTLSKYSVVIGEKERLRVTQNFTAPKQLFKLTKTSWRLRGDFLTRTFDVVDADHSVLMSHGRCWNSCGDCFGVQITRDQDVPACLAVAVIIDSVVLCGTGAAVPVSN